MSAFGRIVVVTAEAKEDEQWQIVATRFSYVTQTKTSDLTQEVHVVHGSAPRDAIVNAGFWTAPAVDAEALLEDGFQWMIEGKRGSAYRALTRRILSERMLALNRTFFELAGLEE
jgi:hypothetical protein